MLFNSLSFFFFFFCLPNLVRFFRILRYGHWGCKDSWLHSDEEFRPSLYCYLYRCVLAAVAYFAVHLVQGLCIHSSGWESMWSGSPELQFDGYLCGQWIVAWGSANTMPDTAIIWNKFLAVPREIAAAIGIIQSEGLKAVTRGVFGMGTISTQFGVYKTVFALLTIGILFFVDWFQVKYPTGMKSQPLIVRWFCYYAWFLVMLYFFISGAPASEFIYFQF